MHLWIDRNSLDRNENGIFRPRPLQQYFTADAQSDLFTVVFASTINSPIVRGEHIFSENRQGIYGESGAIFPARLI